MQYKTMQKSIIAAMTAAILMTTLTGCGGRSNKGGLQVSLEHSYSSEQIKIENVAHMDAGFQSGNTLLIAGSDENYSNEQIYIYNLEDGSSKPATLHYLDSLSKNEDGYVVTCFQEADGGMTFLFNGYSYKNDEYKNLGYTLETYDSELNLLDSKKLDVEDVNFNQLVRTPDGSGYYAAMWDNETGNQLIAVLDEDFRITKKVTGNFQYVENIMPTKDGSVYALYQDNVNYNMVCGKLDAESGTVSTIEIEGMPEWSNRSFPSTTEDYDFYLSDSTAVYGVNTETGICEEVINWINSDFMGNYVDNIMQLEDGRFALTNRDLDYRNSQLWVLSPRDPKELEKMEVISLACLYLSDNLASAITNYNRTNSDYRIALYEYGKFNTEENDYEGGLEKFKNDMTSGIVADIICVDNLPYESLCNKGIFVDLNDYMGNLSDEQYFTNVIRSLAYGDKQYRMGFSFDAYTVEAKTKHVSKGGLTVAEYMELIKNLPKDMVPFQEMSKTSALYTLALGNLNAFVDVTSSTCSFNSPEFAEILEFCNSFTDEGMDYNNMTDSDWEDYWAEENYQYINDKTLFRNVNFYDIRQCYRDRMQYFGEEDVTLVGYPISREGDNGGRFNTEFSLAISANSGYKKQCWEFFEQMLSEEFQESLRWTLPVSKAAFDKKVEEAMKPETYINEDGEEEYEFTVWRGDEEIKVPNMPQSYADEIKEYIANITRSNYYDDQIYSIVREEAEMFFAGDQTAQQAADMIQSRASLYLSEQS